MPQGGDLSKPRRAIVTEAEVKRVIKAARALGIVVSGIRLVPERGGVEVLFGEAGKLQPIPLGQCNEWDQVLK